MTEPEDRTTVRPEEASPVLVVGASLWRATRQRPLRSRPRQLARAAGPTAHAAERGRASSTRTPRRKCTGCTSKAMSWRGSGWTEPGTAACLLPPAVIVDVDETVLDNSPYHVTAVKNGTPIGIEAEWTAWCLMARAKALPGAVGVPAVRCGQGLRGVLHHQPQCGGEGRHDRTSGTKASRRWTTPTCW